MKILKFIKSIFHTHDYERINSTIRCIGYFRGTGIYQVDYICRVCGKTKPVTTDDLFPKP